MLLSFCEDYKSLITKAPCQRSPRIDFDTSAQRLQLLGSLVTESEIELFKVQWRMLHVALNEVNKLSMLRALESGHYLSMSFRSWDLYEYPLLYDQAFMGCQNGDSA